MTKNQSSLWKPDEVYKDNSNLKKFVNNLEKKGLFENNSNFQDLWKWSIKNPETFWSEIWNFTKIKGLKKGKVLKKNKIF